MSLEWCETSGVYFREYGYGYSGPGSYFGYNATYHDGTLYYRAERTYVTVAGWEPKMLTTQPSLSSYFPAPAVFTEAYRITNPDTEGIPYPTEECYGAGIPVIHGPFANWKSILSGTVISWAYYNQSRVRLKKPVATVPAPLVSRWAPLVIAGHLPVCRWSGSTIPGMGRWGGAALAVATAYWDEMSPGVHRLRVTLVHGGLGYASTPLPTVTLTSPYLATATVSAAENATITSVVLSATYEYIGATPPAVSVSFSDPIDYGNYVDNPPAGVTTGECLLGTYQPHHKLTRDADGGYALDPLVGPINADRQHFEQTNLRQFVDGAVVWGVQFDAQLWWAGAGFRPTTTVRFAEATQFDAPDFEYLSYTPESINPAHAYLYPSVIYALDIGSATWTYYLPRIVRIPARAVFKCSLTAGGTVTVDNSTPITLPTLTPGAVVAIIQEEQFQTISGTLCNVPHVTFHRLAFEASGPPWAIPIAGTDEFLLPEA